MVSFLRIKRGSQVSLDIHLNEIRLMHFSPNTEGFLIENFAAETLPIGAIVDGKIKQFDVVQSILKMLVKKTQTQGLQASMAVPANCVLSKSLKMSAKLTNRERRIEITHFLAPYFTDNGEEFCFDFARLNFLPPDQEEILIVASSYEQLHTYVMIATLSGLKVIVVDVDFYAIKRAQTLQEMKRLQFTPQLDAETFLAQTARWQVCRGLAMRRI